MWVNQPIQKGLNPKIVLFINQTNWLCFSHKVSHDLEMSHLDFCYGVFLELIVIFWEFIVFVWPARSLKLLLSSEESQNDMKTSKWWWFLSERTLWSQSDLLFCWVRMCFRSCVWASVRETHSSEGWRLGEWLIHTTTFPLFEISMGGKQSIDCVWQKYQRSRPALFPWRDFCCESEGCWEILC